MTLHDQLEAAIKERLAVAREATRDLTDSDWYSYDDLANTHDKGGAGLTDFDAAFIAANGPDRIIRDCERDLKVLARHPVCRGERDSTHLDEPRCHSCELRQPCPEIANLAEAYGITEAS